MQAVRVVTNMLAGGALEGFSEVGSLRAACQSNRHDCGLHALMTLRALAKHAAEAAHAGVGVDWDSVQLPQGCDRKRNSD